MPKKALYAGIILVPLLLISLIFWLISDSGSDSDSAGSEADAHAPSNRADKSAIPTASSAGQKNHAPVETAPSKDLYVIPTMPAEPPLMPDAPPIMPAEPPPMPDAPTQMWPTPPPMPQNHMPPKR